MIYCVKGGSFSSAGCWPNSAPTKDHGNTEEVKSHCFRDGGETEAQKGGSNLPKVAQRGNVRARMESGSLSSQLAAVRWGMLPSRLGIQARVQ